VVQYKQKHMQEYVQRYLNAFNSKLWLNPHPLNPTI
jgi:hypothetical protein